jgi:hypothetical protein
MAKIFGQLEKAQLENTTSDTGSLPKGMSTYRTDLNVAKISNGTTMIEVADVSTAQTLTNKTLTSPTLTTPNTEVIGLDGQASTPSTPAAGFYKAYVKDSTGKLTVLNSAGTETTVGGGGSSGINYITNPDAESDTTGFATYADAAGTVPVNGTAGSPNSTFTRTTSSPLRSTASFLFTKNSGASRQGEGFSYDFTIDAADKGKVLQGSFEYAIASGTFVDDAMEVFVYDVTNAALIYCSPSKLKNHTLAAEKFGFEFQTSSSSTSYRLIVHVGVATDSANTIKFDNFSVGPAAKLYGSPVTDWQSYTLVIGATTTAPTYGTISQNNAKWRRVGDSMEIQFQFYQSSPIGAGAAGTGTYLFPIPAGYTIDSTKVGIDPDINIASNVGHANGYHITPTSVHGSVHAYNSTNLVLVMGNATNAQQSPGSTYMALSSVETTYKFSARVPIVGWSSSVIMSSDADTRVVAMINRTNPTATITGTDSLVTFGTPGTDTHAAYASGLYTVVVPGLYKVSASLAVSATYAANNNVTITVRKNGTSVNSQLLPAGSASITTLVPTISTLVSCVVGDTLAIGVSTNGTTPTIPSGAFNFFNLEKISGPAQIAASETVAFRAGGVCTGTIDGSYNQAVYPGLANDTHGAYSSGTYTIPSPGFYNIAAGFSITGATITQGNHAAIQIRVNASALAQTMHRAGFTSLNASATNHVSANAVYCVAGDTIKIMSTSSYTTPSYSALLDSAEFYFTVNRV